MSAVEILIADDHELFRRTVRSFIESHPHWRVCGEAGDGIEAVEKAKQLRPHVVLMDINMPRMDGLEATRIIRRELPECNVIIVTQNHETIARQQAAAVDARGAVTKSELTRELRTTIEKLFENPTSQALARPREEDALREGWVRGGGALGQLVREFDWTKTPLGAIEGWPQSLKTVVRVLLTSRFAMWMSWGPELTFLYNDDYARMTLGKKHPWALGKPSQEVWKEIWDDIGPRIRRVLESGEATWDEALLLFLERSGYREETYHTFSYSPLSGDDGTVAGHLCVVTEETDRVIGERRLKTLRSLAGELSKSIAEEDVVACIARCLGENQKDLPFTLIYLFTEDGKEARLACRTGIAKDHPAAPGSIEFSEKNQAWPISDLLSGKDSIIVENLAQRFESVPSGFWDKSPWRALLLPITSQGQDMPAGVIVAALNPYRPLDVSYAGFINLVAGQIAARIASARAYEAEKKRAEALAEIDRAKTAFFSNVSHEFRTPLTLMLGPLQDLLARSQTHLSPTAKEQLDLVSRNGARLLRLVNTLLDFSRIEAGRVQAVYQATDLAGFTSELASVFRSATDKAGLQLLVDCRDLGEPVYVDRDMWEKIVLNLISNAFKFTFDGEIVVSVHRIGNTAELRVRDTGVGIPAEAIPKLFERFNRVPNTRSRTHEGSGIGLALVHELVKLHGGAIRTESNLGQGSTFVVSIPFGQNHLASGQMGGSRSLSSTAVGAKPFVEEALRWLPDSVGRSDEVFSVHDELLPIPCPSVSEDARPRILVADDNSDMRQYLARLLAEHYEIETVADGQAAVEAAREQPPDLIVSDVMMPILDGFELLKVLRADERTRNTPVVLLSARAGEESRVEGIQAGADDYLIKPFSARELLARISARLEIARLQRGSEQRVAADLQAMTRLQEIGNRCTRAGNDFDKCLDEIVAAAIDLTGAEKGNLQLLDPVSGSLMLAAHRGFEEPFRKYFASVGDHDSACGVAMARSERLVVEDVTQGDIFVGKPSLDVLREAGVRAVQSTPLMSSAGQLLGMISTHFPQPHQPVERELRLMDLLARQAADYLERMQAEEALRQRTGQFETLLVELRRSESQLRVSQAELEVRVQERTQELLNASQELRELSARILQAQDEERRRIARELHDGAGQLLAALGMEASNLANEGDKLSSRASASISNIESLVVQMTKDIRTMSHLLYPPLLDEVGLQSALSEYVKGFAERSGIQVSLDLPSSIERLDREHELSLFRIVQESLTNIHRHSASKTAAIRIVRDADALTLEVRDEGRGMPAERLSEIQSRGSGVGIRGMRERVRQFSGTMSIESDRSGTRILVVIPTLNTMLRERTGSDEPLQTAV
jgi:signal transduction histidine kinase/DNA-binding response OmpR family regulator